MYYWNVKNNKVQFILVKNWLLSCFLYHGMAFVSGHFKRLELPTIYKKWMPLLYAVRHPF